MKYDKNNILHIVLGTLFLFAITWVSNTAKAVTYDHSYFTGTSGSTLNDQIGTANGTNTGGSNIQFSGLGPPFNYAIFNGSAAMSLPFDLDTSAMTISDWIETTSTANTLAIVRDNSGSGGTDRTIEAFLNDTDYTTAGHISVIVTRSGSAITIFSSTANNLNNGSPHNIIITSDGNFMYLYIDGTLDTQVSLSNNSAPTGGTSNWFSNGTGANYYVGNNACLVIGHIFTPSSSLPQLWNGGTAPTDCVSGGGGGGGGSTLNFLYPTNLSTTAPFDNFILKAGNVTSTDNYQITVNYFIPQVTGQFTSQVNLTGQQIINNGITLSANQLNTVNVTSASSSTVIANATLIDTTNFQIPDNLNNFIVATSSILFNWITNGTINSNGTSTFLKVTSINSSGTIIATTSPTFNPIAPIVQSSTYYCNAPNNITDIGGGIAYGVCVAGRALFVPSTNYQAGIVNAFTSFQNVFPFNLYFGVVGGVESAISNNNASTTTTLPLTFIGLNGTPYTIVTITSSTLTQALTTTNQTTYFGTTPGCNTACATHDINNFNNIAKMLIWMTTGIKIVGMIVTF